MSAPGLVLIGGGGHAIVVAEAARLAGLRVEGVLDDAPSPVATVGPGAIPRLGTLAEARLIAGRRWIVALGDLGARARVLAALSGFADAAIPVIHPGAIVSADAEIAPGAFIGPGAIVNARADIGPHAIVNSGAIVEHECDIGANAHVAPGAALGGRVRVGPNSLVAIGARVVPGVTIGAGCLVAAGAVVTADVPDGARVAGVPAHPIR